MNFTPLLGCLLALGGPLAAQSAAGRWSLQIRGELTADRGDLRIDSLGGRVLLESLDDRWLPLARFSSSSEQIAFELGATRRFEGSVAPDLMSGRVLEGTREVATWEARRIQPGADRWPVRPRITLRQLVIGSGDTLARFADAWRSRLVSREVLVAEHAALARDAGFVPAGIGDIAARAQRTLLGFDADARRAAQRLLEQIATTPAADDTFRRIFRNRTGGWRLDLHDAAWLFAEEFQQRPIDVPAVLRELAGLGIRADSSTMIQAVWQLWGRQRNTPASAAMLAGINHPDSATGQRLYSLISGYDSAEHWWRSAVQWLMTARWIATAEGWRSPTDLVATFWQRDSLALPSIETHHYATVQAAPVIGVGAIAAVMMRADNAVAEEWLRDPRHRDQALDIWRRFEFGDAPPMRMTIGDRSLRVASAARVAQSRLGGFLAGHDAIRIEPAIMPVFAVGTLVHEWQHLLFEASRLAGESPSAFRDMPWGITLIEADPWLGEGAAEWATDMVLAPARGMTPLFALAEMEKRLAIGAGLADDTHVLGYLLVRAAVNRVASAQELRRFLERHLHDPAAFAAAVGFGGAASVGILRPSTLVVIPEVSFTFDGGVADGVTRRLVVPDPAREN